MCRRRLGRWLSHEDQDPHSAGPVMLSYGYWQRRFGGDRGVIGRNIQVDSQAREIVGVMPRGFRVWWGLGFRCAGADGA